MSENIERQVELERTSEENLADDVVFEPSLIHKDRRVAIAVMDGLHVCWCCFKSVTASTSLDALMGEGIVVRICEDNLACRKKVGEANRKRDRDREAGNIIQLADLNEAQRVELVEEIKEKKKAYRGD